MVETLLPVGSVEQPCWRRDSPAWGQGWMGTGLDGHPVPDGCCWTRCRLQGRPLNPSSHPVCPRGWVLLCCQMHHVSAPRPTAPHSAPGAVPHTPTPLWGLDTSQKGPRCALPTQVPLTTRPVPADPAAPRAATMPDSPADVKTQPRSTPPNMPPPPPAVTQGATRHPSFTPSTSEYGDGDCVGDGWQSWACTVLGCAASSCHPCARVGIEAACALPIPGETLGGGDVQVQVSLLPCGHQIGAAPVQNCRRVLGQCHGPTWWGSSCLCPGHSVLPSGSLAGGRPAAPVLCALIVCLQASHSAWSQHRWGSPGILMGSSGGQGMRQSLPPGLLWLG